MEPGVRRGPPVKATSAGRRYVRERRQLRSRRRKACLRPGSSGRTLREQRRCGWSYACAAAAPGKSSTALRRTVGADQSRRVACPALSYLFFRRLFVVVGIIEKVDELLRAGSIGAGLTVVLTLTLPDGVNVVFVRMRMVPPKVGSLHTISLPEGRVV